MDASKPGMKIDRNIFGQFAEHLGHGIYDGIWVGPDSRIPNTRGIRNDVVDALKALKVVIRHNAKRTGKVLAPEVTDLQMWPAAGRGSFSCG